MIYYILFPGDTELDTLYDKNILGETSFKTFASNDGYLRLKHLIETESKLLEKIKIIDSLGQEFNVNEFLSTVEHYKFK